MAVQQTGGTPALEALAEAEQAGAALQASLAWLDEAADTQEPEAAEQALGQAAGWLAYLSQDLSRLGLTGQAEMALRASQDCSQVAEQGVAPDLATWQTEYLPSLQSEVAAITVLGGRGLRRSFWFAVGAMTVAVVGTGVIAVVADQWARQGELPPRPQEPVVHATRYRRKRQ